MPAGRDWFIEQRLGFIDWALLNRGSVGRREIAATFGVSMSQASADIAAFVGEHPGVIAYDTKAKRYVRGRRYRPGKGIVIGPLVVTIAPLD